MFWSGIFCHPYIPWLWSILNKCHSPESELVDCSVYHWTSFSFLRIVSSVKQLCLISGDDVAGALPLKLGIYVVWAIMYLIRGISIDKKKKVNSWKLISESEKQSIEKISRFELKASFAVWMSLMVISVFQWNFWVVCYSSMYEGFHTLAVVVISLKFLSSYPASACRAWGKGQF